MTTRQNQRGLMVLATAAIVLLAFGSFVALSRSSGDVDLIGPAETTEADEAVPTTTATVEPDPDTTSSPTTAPTPVPTLDPDFDGLIVTQTCGNGTSSQMGLATNDPEQIDDLVNTFDLCEGQGGLASITYPVDCGDGPREVTLDTVDGALPDIATIDSCENDGQAAGGDFSLELQALTGAELDAAGVEAIGCWFSFSDVDEPIFFSGFDGGVIKTGGDIIRLDRGSAAANGGLDDGDPFEPGALFSNEGYSVSFTNLGEPVDTSIESRQWDVTMTVNSASGNYGPLDGVIWCGV